MKQNTFESELKVLEKYKNLQQLHLCVLKDRTLVSAQHFFSVRSSTVLNN